MKINEISGKHPLTNNLNFKVLLYCISGPLENLKIKEKSSYLIIYLQVLRGQKVRMRRAISSTFIAVLDS